MLEYRVDSLAAVEVQKWLESIFAIDLPIFEIMGGASFVSIGRTVAQVSRRSWQW